jgi:hypothetical protein
MQRHTDQSFTQAILTCINTIMRSENEIIGALLVIVQRDPRYPFIFDIRSGIEAHAWAIPATKLPTSCQTSPSPPSNAYDPGYWACAYDDFVNTVFWGAVVTGRVYDLSPRMQEKRNVRYAVAAELRRIVGEPVQMEHEMRQAA